MTGVQAFNWFCKEQNIIPIIREIFYKVRPTSNTWKMPPTYLSFGEYIENIINSGGMSELLIRIENSYYYKVGWNNFDKFRKEHNIENLLKKWHYFVKNNLQICEDNLKIGDTISFRSHYWYAAGGDAALNNRSGKVLSINLGKYTVVVEEDDGGRREIFINDIVNDGTTESKDIDFYIKRNRKTYYGANRK